MELEIVSRDARGWIGVVKLPDGKEVIMIYTRKGFLRGGEFHNSNQHDIVLHGSLKWTLGGRSKIQKKGDAMTIPQAVPHLAEALEDTLYCEYLDSMFEKTFVPELRKLVDDRLKA